MVFTIFLFMNMHRSVLFCHNTIRLTSPRRIVKKISYVRSGPFFIAYAPPSFLNPDGIFVICFCTSFLNKLYSHQKCLTLSRSIVFIEKEKKRQKLCLLTCHSIPSFVLFPLFSCNILFSTTSFLHFQ